MNLKSTTIKISSILQFLLVKTDSFLINSSGTIGSAGAALTVSYSTDFPEILYYNVERSGFISTADKTVTGYNEIQYNNSVFSGEYAISGVTSTTYGINLTHVPERVSYAATECDLLKYTTKSTNANGSIDKVDLIFPGLDYKKFPSISSITSGLGTDTVLRLNFFYSWKIRYSKTAYTWFLLSI